VSAQTHAASPVSLAANPVDRGRHAVLVPQVNAVGMIGVVRSLGRAGYAVHACSDQADALGLASRFAAAATVHPAYDDPAFLPWLRAYVERHRIAAIVPSEGFLIGIKPAYEAFRHLMPDQPGREVVYRCLSKADVSRRLEGSSAASFMPPGAVLDDTEGTVDPARFAGFPLPLYVKGDACLAKAGADGAVIRCATAVDAARAAERLFERFPRVQVQGSVPGRKACVNLFLHEGQVVAESMCLARHENPHTGGLTAYRHSWWHQAMRDDALAKLRRLGWTGVAMVEYKWDAASRTFHFIELNARYWAALHLDLYAGTDFPRLQLDRFLGAALAPVARQPLGVPCRHTVPADFGYAASRARDPNVPWPARLWAVMEFFLLFLHPRLRCDLYFPGDRGLYWRQWRQFFGSFQRRR
jgi:hypothetical protein